MTKKNLPHIPLYVGDWKKDCNVLSLSAEAAWLNIIFILHTKGNTILEKNHCFIDGNGTILKLPKKKYNKSSIVLTKV